MLETAVETLWTQARAEIRPKSWDHLGSLVFRGSGYAVGHVVAAGLLSADGQPLPEDASDHVSIWCPDVAARWLSLREFAAASGSVFFQGTVEVWARNDLDQLVEVDLRVRYHESTEPLAAPDATPAYYAAKAWKNTTWFGAPVLKCPYDLWVMQEIIFEVNAGLVIETGTFKGGSAAYFACLLDSLRGQVDDGAGVLTVDVEEHEVPDHTRVTYLRGSSLDPDVLRVMRAAADRAPGFVVVVLDSDHSYDHVLAELRAYAPFVTAGSYLIVEDTNTPGPAEAVADFLASPEGRDFEVDRSREKFGTTFNPGGWLRRKANTC